ncbi:Bacillopeptidase F [Orchesella cincta]|uniref:Bacillopeptidase F n=1 Tax=Orchesella cincta TaxID=48709 RepID=A0A1D2MKL7_ORCCI|nr:Bacillopeptidase F [Orchesella cincta]
MLIVEALADEHQWGVVKIQAPEAWQELGTLSGEGVIIATVDTGVRGTHEALKDNFVGEYGWFDPSTSTPTPTDNNGHGTHTTGTIAGGKGHLEQNGLPVVVVLPQLAINPIFSPVETSSLAPLVLMDPAQTAAKAPNVVSNSWGGGRGNTWYNGVIEDGMQLKSSHFSPTETLDQVATLPILPLTKTSLLFSSVGPTTDGRMKPEVSAPGSNVISAYHTSDTAYVSLSGTSMACPHAAGAIALLQVRTRTFLT